MNRFDFNHCKLLFLRSTIYFILLILNLFSSLLIAVNSSYKNISQIVIVYAPKEDRSGAFFTQDESLTKLFSAAKKQNLKVVLIDVDKIENSSARNSIKQVVLNHVSSQPSFLIVAGHGNMIQYDDGTTDTSLEFPGGFKFSDLSESFNNRNFSGILLDS